MNKALSLKKTLVALGAVGIITVVGVVMGGVEVEPMQPEEVIVQVEKCNEVELDVSGERICLTSKDYKTIKKNLHEEYKNKSKGYDFDINKRDIFLAILSKEIKENGVDFDKLKDKEFLMETFFNN